MAKQNKKGKFIVIDGSDGSGKQTQTRFLRKRLQSEKVPHLSVDFPVYQSFFGRFIKRYLHGDFGDPVEMDPYHASFAYALDRFFAKEKIERALATGKIVIANRYMESNKMHQGAKFTSRTKLNQYLDWLDRLEFDKLEVPKPDLVFYLHVPSDISRGLIKQRGRKTDGHEKNTAYQKKVVQTAKYLCRKYQHWQQVDCVKRGELLSRPEIHDMIWNKTKKTI